MMMNLFSIFDPSSAMLSLSWVAIPAMVTMVTKNTWKISSNMNKILTNILFLFKKEVKFTLKKTESSTEIMIMGVFLSILIMNGMALYPQNFSPTSHLTVTLPLSLLFWLTLMLFGWTKNTNHMLAHLLPQGTPVALMPFMVMIEMISNIIRPITLCIRLTANLIAGHLLMSLLGSSLMSLPIMFTIPSFLSSILLTILESAVAGIQAYVFMTLITLYTTETK